MKFIPIFFLPLLFQAAQGAIAFAVLNKKLT